MRSGVEEDGARGGRRPPGGEVGTRGRLQSTEMRSAEGFNKSITQCQSQISSRLHSLGTYCVSEPGLEPGGL